MRFISSSSLRSAWGGSGEGERSFRKGWDHTRETAQSFEDRTTHILPKDETVVVVSNFLLETGSGLMLEDGSKILVES